MIFDTKQEIAEFRAAFPERMENIFIYNCKKPKTFKKAVASFIQIIKNTEIRDNDNELEEILYSMKVEVGNLLKDKQDQQSAFCLNFNNSASLVSARNIDSFALIQYSDSSPKLQSIMDSYSLNHEIAHALTREYYDIIGMDISHLQYAENIADSFAVIRILQNFPNDAELDSFISNLILFRTLSACDRQMEYLTTAAISEVMDIDPIELNKLNLEESLNLALKIAGNHRKSKKELDDTELELKSTLINFSDKAEADIGILNRSTEPLLLLNDFIDYANANKKSNKLDGLINDYYKVMKKQKNKILNRNRIFTR